MNNEANETREREISISFLFKVLKKNVAVICIATVLFGIFGGLYSVFFQKTKYTATAEFHVNNILPTAGYVTDAMLSAASKIADSCVEVAKKDVLAKKAVEDPEHELDKYFGVPKTQAVSYVKSMISAGKSNTDSQIFYVTVTSQNKDHTYHVILAIQDVMQEVANLVTQSELNSVSAPKLALVTEIEEEKQIKTVTPSHTKYALLGAILGLVASYAVTFVIAINDTKIYGEETVKQNFSQPVIGAIPQWMAESDMDSRKLSHKKRIARDVGKTTRRYTDKLITKDTPFAITESFKLLRTNLCYSIAADSCPVFAITSDYSGSGKSLVSANLAVTFAQLGKRTLLVEGDMRCPDLRHIFGEESAHSGLSELLSGNVEKTADATVSTSYDKLSVVFSGRIPPNPTELLGSERMKALVDEWKASYDVVIIDLPPVHEVADACVISPLVSGYVLVARTEHSEINSLAASVDSIKRLHGTVCGFVVNDINIKLGSRASRTYNKYSVYGSERA